MEIYYACDNKIAEHRLMSEPSAFPSQETAIEIRDEKFFVAIKFKLFEKLFSVSWLGFKTALVAESRGIKT